MARTVSLAAFFLALCCPGFAWADEPAAAPSATPQQVHQTVERAIVYQQAESTQWLKNRVCAACHHVYITFHAHRHYVFR